MQSLRNLRLSFRLGGAFGLVVLGLLVVALLGATRVSSVKGDANQLADVKMKAQTIAGGMAQRSSTVAFDATQHLYVYDGDLKTQDGMAKEIKDLETANTADAARFAKLVAGTPAADDVQAYADARKAFNAAANEPGNRPPQET